jgi:hypothetical protein
MEYLKLVVELNVGIAWPLVNSLPARALVMFLLHAFLGL